MYGPAMNRCFAVYALAPETMTARASNDAVNEYIGERARGVAVWHDHFVGKPRGGIAVVWARSAAEVSALRDPGPLREWQVGVHPLTFSLTAVGFSAQTDLTLEGYGGTSLAAERAVEPDDPAFWWRRRR